MAMSSGDDDEEIFGINVTPLVDVCLVLVIILMVTAPMMANPVMKVELPKAHTKEGEESDKVTLTLGKDGRIALEYRIFPTLASMLPALRILIADSASRLVILRADKDASNGQLLDLMAAAKDAGALSLTIATEKEK
jgi:biopolymer transport protein ExbD/biopolymer transport protein TolR